MPRIHFDVNTSLSPDQVLAVLTDFSPRRADVWPNIDKEHLQIHGQGPQWADVTEGNALAGGIWERSRYEWGEEPGRVTITTLESNVWKPGSGWDYRLTPSPTGGTAIRVDVRRNGHGPKGLLLGLVLAMVGARLLRGNMHQVLRPLEQG
jgi:hypothetical protein